MRTDPNMQKGGFAAGKVKWEKTKARYQANRKEIKFDLEHSRSFSRVARKWHFDPRTLKRLIADEQWEGVSGDIKSMFAAREAVKHSLGAIHELHQPSQPLFAEVKPSDVQVGGDHYKKLVIQPAEYCTANKLPSLESAVVKYITRWRDKGGFIDLDKIKHVVELIKEMEEKYGDAKRYT